MSIKGQHNHVYKKDHHHPSNHSKTTIFLAETPLPIKSTAP
jgi:hypothetical protein